MNISVLFCGFVLVNIYALIRVYSKVKTKLYVQFIIRLTFLIIYNAKSMFFLLKIGLNTAVHKNKRENNGLKHEQFLFFYILIFVVRMGRHNLSDQQLNDRWYAACQSIPNNLKLLKLSNPSSFNGRIQNSFTQLH